MSPEFRPSVIRLLVLPARPARSLEAVTGDKREPKTIRYRDNRFILPPVGKQADTATASETPLPVDQEGTWTASSEAGTAL